MIRSDTGVLRMTDLLVLFALLVAALGMVAVIMIVRAIMRVPRRTRRKSPLL
jgi:hypothetical protein